MRWTLGRRRKPALDTENTRALETERRLQLTEGRLTGRERELLQRLDCRVHVNDDMWTPAPEDAWRPAERYTWAGLRAIHAIERGLAAVGGADPRVILDLPSGYGRVLRFLRAAYPEAEIVACDLNAEAVQFCAQQFGAEPRGSTPDLDRVSFTQRFDLVWCGSLLTHLDEPGADSLIALFGRSLAPGAVAVVTTHGEQLARKPDGVWNGGLEPDAVARVREAVERTGFGWEPYGGEGRYGAAIISREWLRERARRLGLTEEWFEEGGWGGYQDACSLARGLAPARC